MARGQALGACLLVLACVACGGSKKGDGDSGVFECPPPCDCFSAVGAGESFSCAVRAGEVWCWGRGPLGRGTWADSSTPLRVAGLSEVQDLAVGRWHACALTQAGEVFCWGRNEMGQVNDSGAVALSPVPVEVAEPVAQLAVADRYSCVLTTAGDARCWGSRPLAPQGELMAAELALDETHMCLRRADGSVACAGSNPNGQFGDGTVGGDSSVAVLSQMQDAVQIDVGQFDSLAVDAKGEVYWWGWDALLGMRSTPEPVGGIAGARQVSAGPQHRCVIADGGQVFCWGLGGVGRLGDGFMQDSVTPREVALTAPARSLAAGHRHTCVSLEGGPVYCWGYNDFGQLGNGTTDHAAKPQVVPLACP